MQLVQSCSRHLQSANLGQGLLSKYFLVFVTVLGHCVLLEQYLFVFCFRMRAKTNDFLKILNRAKIEDENNKKVSKFRK